jgi:adenylate cyclase
MSLRQRLQQPWQRRGVIAIAPSLAGLVILLRAIGLFQAWEWAAFDQFMRSRPLEPPDHRIVVVGLNEKDVSEIGQAIVPDGIYAQVIEKLRSQSPRAIGLDIYRDLPVEPGHRELTDIFKTTPNLVGIQKVVGNRALEAVSPSAVLAELGQIGANDIVTDADNTVRRGLLSVQTTEGETVYSLSLYLALLYLEAEDIQPRSVSEDTWWLGKTLFEPFEADDGGYVRADANGY